MKKTLLVRGPSKKFSHTEEKPLDFSEPRDDEVVDVDIEKMRDQWAAYVKVFADRGWDVIELESKADNPRELFIEDSVAVYHTVALMGRSEIWQDEAKTDDVKSTLEDLGFAVASVKPPGTMCGGDVLQHGSVAHVGRGTRTNAEGVGVIRRLLQPLGVKVVAVPLSGVPYMKCAATSLPDGTAIGRDENLFDVRVFDRFIQAPEAAGASVVLLNPTDLIVSASAPGTAALLQNLGFRVTVLDISEMEKMDGCLSSLSVRLRDQL